MIVVDRFIRHVSRTCPTMTMWRPFILLYWKKEMEWLWNLEISRCLAHSKVNKET
jgi:hypothetical protein